MATPPQMRERQDRILAELSELGLVLARDLQACALAADEISDKADLSLAFHRTSRSVRQTLALEARLERDRRTAEREDHQARQHAESVCAGRRKAQVKLAVERLIWSEFEESEAEILLGDLDDHLERDTLSGAFAGDEPVEIHIARLCQELGVTASSFPAGRGGGEADGGDFGSDPAGPAMAPWRRSG